MTSATSTITNETNYTAQATAATDTVTGSASTNLTSTDFLNLLLEQLQYQDPMSPTDNSEFVTQECQFAQLSQTTETNTNLVSSQAASLVGKNVTITDPDDSTKTISGNVTSSTIDGSNSTITIGGTEYPISDLVSVNELSTTATTSSTSN